MSDIEIFSWIFLAIGLGSKESEINFSGIALLADGINHVVPTQKELNNAIAWLKHKDLIRKNGKNYLLSETGKQILANAENKEKTIIMIWQNIESQLSFL